MSATDHSTESLKEMAERCVAMARLHPRPVVWASGEISARKAPPDLDLFDRQESIHRENKVQRSRLRMLPDQLLELATQRVQM